MTSPDPARAREIEWDCLDTVNRFYRHLDAREYDEVAALWHDEGLWERERPIGKADIAASLAKRSPTSVVHHMVSSMTFDRVGEDEVRFSCYVTTVRGDTGSPPARAIHATTAHIYLSCGALRPTPHGWRLSHYAHGPARLSLHV